MPARLLAAAVALLMVAGCSHRKPGACTVICADDSRCPEDNTCGADGYCHAAGDTSVCLPGEDLPDAGPPADGADPADGDPCDGAADEISDLDRRDVFIPDDDVSGVDRTLGFTGSCVTVTSIEVRVEIRHEYRGDVEIRLTSPSGDTALVLDSSDDPTPNIFETFEVDLAEGESADGDWVLNVRDVVADLVGTLEYWSIGINMPAP
ncbi:MAG TPA: proprotein convertase P-domain-containing protein [Kofleriaceae bacterium]|nr:proprotein convertase P-domain-containing protein [Kofleriaceae bacterium]